MTNLLVANDPSAESTASNPKKPLFCDNASLHSSRATCWSERMRHALMLVPAAAVFYAALIGGAQQSSSGPADWPTYNHDLAGTRYSPLTQITVGNVSRLTQSWVYRAPA